MLNLRLMAKFIWWEFLAPFGMLLLGLLLLPILVPAALVGLSAMRIGQKWDEFKRIERATAAAQTPKEVER